MPSLLRFVWVLVAGLVALSPCVAVAQASDLQLRIETGVHEAIINRMALSPDGATIYTASDDKTARAWSADRLVAQGIMRPPVGGADDGALYAIAVSARRIAVAGRVRDASGTFALHLFARNDLHPIGNIAAFPEPIRAMRFSADGSLLAVGMQDRAGLRVLNLDTPAEMFRDIAYDGTITWMDFDAHGALAVVADDDRMRLYSPGFRQTTPYRLPAGGTAWGVAFSPDGARIAVGDRRRPLVHLFDVTRGRFARDFEGAPQREGGLGVVAFSRDGQTLFAGGTYKAETQANGAGRGAPRLLRQWRMDGRAIGEVPVATDTITDIAVTDVAGSAGVVFASAEPAIGKLDATGRLVASVRSRHVDFRDAGPTSFRVSRDGSMIEMPSGPVPAATLGPSVVFDVIGRRFISPSAVPGGFANPFATASGTSIAEWQNNHSPRVNGQLVKLQSSEMAHAVAVVPGGAGAAIGTDFFVRLFANGREKWQAIATAPVWAVNASGDGRLVVAALGDGTIHWYRSDTGRELLALFPDPATGRWVLFTREGFFDHDHRIDGLPDGRTLIGFQTSAPEAAANPFIQIGQLYPSFFRPDLVGLSFRDNAVARLTVDDQHERSGSVPTILARGLPPRFRLIDVCTNVGVDPSKGCAPANAAAVTTAGRVRIRYRIDRPAGEIGSITIRRNQAVISPPIIVEKQEPHGRVELAEIALGLGDNDIMFTPVSPGGQVEASEQASLHVGVRRLPLARSTNDSAPIVSTPKVAAELDHPITLHVLSVGVSEFSHPGLNLAHAADDARAFADLMQHPTPPVSNAVGSPPPLLDGQATRANILAALKDIAAESRPDDLVVLFFAGHGEAIDGKYYFAPTDLGTANSDFFRAAMAMKDPVAHDRALDEIYRKEGVSEDEMLPLIRSIQAARVAIILDTCYSATLASADAVTRRDENDTVTNSLGHAGGRFVLSGAVSLAMDSDAGANATGADTVVEDAEGHGLFSAFLLRALAGEADFNRNGRIDIYKLATFTAEHVKEASQTMTMPQSPSFYFNGNDFFALRATQTR